MKEWDKIVEKVSPYIVKIETPTGSGTGFLCAYNEDKSLCGVATALHVVSDADEWQQPIRIHNNAFSQTVFLREGQRFVFTEHSIDSAVILFNGSNLDFPEVLIPLRPIEAPISIGVDVGWLGFPAIDPYTLCFFAGPISARQDTSKAYLIDGVAINGVSGGPPASLTTPSRFGECRERFNPKASAAPPLQSVANPAGDLVPAATIDSKSISNENKQNEY